MKKINIKREYDCKNIYNLLLKDLEKYYNNINEKIITEYIMKFINKNTLYTDLKNIKYIIKILQLLYENDLPLIDDSIYDKLVDKYKRYKGDEPVGAKTVTKIKVDRKHEFPLLRGTLDKARYIYVKDIPQNEDGYSIETFINKCFEIEPELIIRLSSKYDGVSGIIDIDNNKIKSVISRGEDEVGADFTHLFKNIHYDEIDSKEYGLKTEIIMTKEDYDEYCKEKGYTYSNLRSSVVSVITALDGEKYSKYLTLVPLMVVDKHGELSGEDILKFNKKVPFSFKTITASSYKSAMTQIVKFINNILSIRSELNFAIDGIVIDILNPKVRKELGRKNNKNKWQIAYKFPPEIRRTIVRDVKFTHGRTGLITPMVYYDEIDFNGTNHNKSSLSSYKRFTSLDLNRGDEIIVTYNNDVMPYVFKIKDCKKGLGIKFKYPKHCGCGAPSVLVGANYMCLNPDCFYKNIYEIAYFFTVLGIEDFSEKSIQKLIENNVIESFTDLFKLKDSDLNIEGFGKKKKESLLKQLDALRKKPITEDVLCHALSISGEKTCEAIFNSGITINQVMKDANILLKLRIDGIKDKKMNKFIKKFIRKSPVILELMKVMNIVSYKKTDYIYSVLFTGFRDKELKQRVEDMNIKVEDSSMKNIKYLVTVDASYTSSKIDRAKKQGINIITKDEFIKLLNM